MNAALNSSASERIERFEYPAGPDAPAVPVWDGWTTDVHAPEETAGNRPRGTAETGASHEQRLTEEARRSFEAGCERARLEGRQTEREAQAAALAAAEERRVRQAAELIESFARERDRYLHAVEHEVVELALAVAARILRREAQMDPLLLTGAVRVALGQLSGSTQVEVRVPAAELDLWTNAISLFPNLRLKPTVVSGDGMLLGDCAIKTSLGTVDLGIRSQLGEIERGFFDRAGSRKTETPKPLVAKPAVQSPAVQSDAALSASPEPHS
jgi:flagellar assembly protein FliH